MTDRVYNFSAGPAVLPLPVLEKAQSELTCLPGAGASVLEISHRSKTYIEISEQAEATVKALLGAGDDYRVLFLQGGARLQFGMIPLNFLVGAAAPADYIVTGSWGKKAVEEARLVGDVRVAWDGKADNYDRAPKASTLGLNDEAPYVYITSNETIEGVQFPADPNTGAAPLVCDASSDIFCRPTPIEKYGLLFACAQKNAGPAGVTIVVIRKELIEKSNEKIPSYLQYKPHADNDSMYNTPPCFGVYMVGLVAKWLCDDIGGLAEMEKINRRKSQMLYDVIDAHDDFYKGHALPSCRSLMNVTFRLPSEELEAKFLAEAKTRKLTELKGHRSVGGMRASIYNAMPEAGVKTLAEFMKDFASKNG